MSLAPHEVGKVGRLSMAFASEKGKTVLRDAYCEIPFKITKLFYPETTSIPQLIIMNPTAGLFGGDQTTLGITVESGARVCVTTQAAQKIHPSHSGLPAEQTTKIHVQSEGELHYFLDPLIPFADATLHQKTIVILEENARLFFWDGLSAGRILSQEQWQFQEVRSTLEVYLEDQLLYLDRFSINPRRHTPDAPFMVRHFPYLATALAFAPQITHSVTEQFQTIVPLKNDEILGAFDNPQLPLMVGRFVTKSGVAFSRIQNQFHAAVFENLLQESYMPIRK